MTFIMNSQYFKSSGVEHLITKQGDNDILSPSANLTRYLKNFRTFALFRC